MPSSCEAHHVEAAVTALERWWLAAHDLEEHDDAPVGDEFDEWYVDGAGDA